MWTETIVSAREQKRKKFSGFHVRVADKLELNVWVEISRIAMHRRKPKKNATRLKKRVYSSDHKNRRISRNLILEFAENVQRLQPFLRCIFLRPSLRFILSFCENQRFFLRQTHFPLNDRLKRERWNFVRRSARRAFTSLLPDLFRYFVEAMYDALTVRTTAFIKFFAAVISDVALSSWTRGKTVERRENHRLVLRRWRSVRHWCSARPLSLCWWCPTGGSRA